MLKEAKLLRNTKPVSYFPLFQAYFLLVCLCSGLIGCAEPKPPPDKTQSTANETAETPNRPRQIKPVDVLIVGAGLSGLSTAYHLKKAGISYHLAELEPRVGGRIRTGHNANGSFAEVGLAEFWDGNPALEIAKELNVPTERVDTGVSSFMVQGKLYPFKGNSNQEFIASVLKPEEYKAFQAWDEMMGKYLTQIEHGEFSKELMALKEISMADWMAKQKISPFAQSVVQALMEPEIGTSWKRISALDGIAEWHLFHKDGANPNHMVGGNEKLPEALAKHLGPEHISLNTQVTNVVDTADGVEVRAVDKTNFDTLSFKAKYVVMAIPLYRMFEIQFQPRLDDKVYQAVHSQGWGAYFTAHVVVDKAAEKYWTLNGSSVLPILTDTALGVIYPGLGQENKETILLNLLVTGDYAEKFNARTGSLDDAQKELTETFEKQFPGITPMLKEWTFYRYHPRAIASWPVGRSRYDDLSNFLRQAHGRVYFGSDFTESSHSDGAGIAALRISKQIAEREKKGAK